MANSKDRIDAYWAKSRAGELMGLLERGSQPTKKELIEYLRLEAGPIAQPLRKYIAELLENSKLPARYEQRDKIKWVGMFGHRMAEFYEAAYLDFEEDGSSNPSKAAYEWLANRLGVGVKTVERLVTKARKLADVAPRRGRRTRKNGSIRSKHPSK